jgi:galactose-1-phosphate uridylyltransferase
MWLAYFQLNRLSMLGAKKSFNEETVSAVPLMRYDVYYHQMPDGTVKQINPFNGTEVWAVPGRGSKPLDQEISQTAQLLHPKPHEDHCSFCETRYTETPPEKFRLVCQDGTYKKITQLSATEYNETKAEFRRVPNLFEIVTLDYWRKNYNFKMTKAQLAWRERYLSEADGLKHVLNVVDYKLSKMGRSAADIQALALDDKLSIADAFFGGSHELIIAGRHFKRGAKFDSELYSSGEMTADEHDAYFNATIDALKDIYANNRYVRYISVFQNWLKPAGASFDHLHKQLVGLDSWSISIENQIQMLRSNPNVFNEYGPNLAIHYNLVFAENDYAIAYAAVGHRFPTLAVYSKSQHSRPQDHTPEEVRGMSDLVHACHVAMGGAISCNEEWFYTPIDSVYNMPWKILIKWRINIPAGFEGNTSIYINPISPLELRDRIVPRLYQVRDQRLINNGISIAEECRCELNPLKYYMR